MISSALLTIAIVYVKALLFTAMKAKKEWLPVMLLASRGFFMSE